MTQNGGLYNYYPTRPIGICWLRKVQRRQLLEGSSAGMIYLVSWHLQVERLFYPTPPPSQHKDRPFYSPYMTKEEVNLMNIPSSGLCSRAVWVCRLTNTKPLNSPVHMSAVRLPSPDGCSCTHLILLMESTSTLPDGAIRCGLVVIQSYFSQMIRCW